jgi:hypothetical protein
LGNATQRDAHAIDVAAYLSGRFGEQALACANQRRTDAVAKGNILRADLYRAVCTVIADRNGVFSRSRAKTRN